MSKFGSLITAMVTPFKKGDKTQIDFEAVEKIVEHLVKTQSESIIVAGTTGESPTLTHDEEIELLKCVQAKIKNLKTNTQVIFGAGSNSTETSITMSQRAEKANADGLLLVTPYYNKPNQKGLKEHFSLIASKTNLPIILYNVPGRAVISLQAQTITELHKEFSQISSLKEASNNIDIVTKVLNSVDSTEFSVYSGDDSLTLPMLAVGAQGVISVASHLVGKEMQSMIQEYKAGRVAKALEIHQKLFQLFEILFIEPNPTCIKEALGIIGICAPELRGPLVSLNPEQRAELKKILSTTVTQTA